MSGIIDFRTELEDENGNAITNANPLPVSVQSVASEPVHVQVDNPANNPVYVQVENDINNPVNVQVGNTTNNPVPVTAKLEDSNGNLITALNPLPVTPTNTEDNPLEVKSSSLDWLLTRILTALSAPMGYDKTQQRQRGTVVLESGTVTTVANITNLNGDQSQILLRGANLTAWHQCVRSRIS